MGEHMAVRVEVWPIAADRSGIWLLAAEPWRSSPIPADGSPAAEVEMVLWANGPEASVAAVHSTSWRLTEPSVTLTYVAVVQVDDLVQDWWPDARPITPELAAEVGKPYPHHPAGEPVPRDIDVLMHALRHLRFLLDTDTSTTTALGHWWAHHLADWTPALAGLYTD